MSTTTPTPSSPTTRPTLTTSPQPTSTRHEPCPTDPGTRSSVPTRKRTGDGTCLADPQPLPFSNLFRCSRWQCHHTLYHRFGAHFLRRGPPSRSCPSRPSINTSSCSSARPRLLKSHPHLKGLPDYASALAIEASTGPLRRTGIPFTSSPGTLPTTMTLRPLLVTVAIPLSPSSPIASRFVSGFPLLSAPLY